MSTQNELTQALRADADAADTLDHDAIWARVSIGIHRRRRRRRAAAATGAAVALVATVVALPVLDRVTLGPLNAPVAGAPPAPSAPSSPSPSPSESARVPPEVLAPVASEPRATTDGTVAWAIFEECAVGTPSTASTMLTARDGTGEFEAPTDVQQVALFPDTASAVAEFDRVRQALDRCDAGSDLVTTETLDVGDQNVGVASVYGDDEGAPTPFGTYAVLTRRGTAVTLVTVDGGDGSPESSRDMVVERASQAWENLCDFDSAGC